MGVVARPSSLGLLYMLGFFFFPLNSSALAVEHNWFWYLSAPSMEREWAWVWPPEVTEADICLEATRAALEALSLVGVVPLGGELRVGVILGGVDWGVLLPLILASRCCC